MSCPDCLSSAGSCGTEDGLYVGVMPLTTACANCGVVGSVRWERVLKGTQSFTEFYCGRCEHTWRVFNEERRVTPRPAPKRNRLTRVRTDQGT